MLKRSLFCFLSFSLLFPALGCFRDSGGSSPKSASQARLFLPNWGITIDATYDRKLDGLVPGYKIVTIALSNRSFDLIKLDPNNDQWFIENASGKKLKGIISLRTRDPNTWGQLPSKVKDIIEYPPGVQMGYTQTFDIFFPDHLDLDRFRAVSFYSAALKQNFDALSSTAMERAVPSEDGYSSTESIEKYSPRPKPNTVGAPRKSNAAVKYK